MIDFDKLSGGVDEEKTLAPVEIYNELDRKVDKGPLRPAQIAVLNDWFDNYKSKKDVMLKLVMFNTSFISG